MTIEYTSFLPSGKEDYEFEEPNCCLDTHPQLVFLTGGSWMLECKNCASNLVSIEVHDPVVGGQPEDLDREAAS